MTDHPTVSVIIPAYNAEHSLAPCIDSVLAQTHDRVEVLVIDDGSTDGTCAIASGYGDPVICLKQANQGQGAARNRGLASASGDYVAFLDADDYWLDTFIETCVDFLDTHPDAVAVSTGHITKMADGSEQVGPACLQTGGCPKEPVILENFFDFWGAHDHVRTGTVLIRRSTIESAGYQRPDLRVSQDLEYWAYIATFGMWGFIPTPLWVGNSRAVAVKGGWLNKYRKRRRLCPTVESWQERVEPRIGGRERAGFMQVRGRVAAGYAQYMILSGRTAEARTVIRNYAPDLPRNRLTRVLLAGYRLGTPGWWLACCMVRAREMTKAFRMQFARTSAG